MLSYAWSVHFFYGVILKSTGELIEHAVFWSIFYPISIFLLSTFLGKRLKYEKTTEHIKLFGEFLMSGFLLCIMMWEVFKHFNGVCIWSFLTSILIILVLIELCIELRERNK